MSHKEITREQIVAEARSWLGTPYHHQAALRGVGADCLGLLRGVYTALVGGEPETPPPYSASWGESDGQELLLNAAHRYLRLVDYPKWKAGDVLIFRVRNARSAKHCAIALDGVNMIHAVSQRGVLITGIGEWDSRVAGVFSFPGVV